MDPEKEGTQEIAPENSNIEAVQKPEAEAKPAEAAATTDSSARDYDAELKARDATVADLNRKISEVQGQSKTAHAEREKLMLEIAEHLKEKGEISKERDEALAKQSETLETMSKATRVVSDEKDDLAAKLAAAQEQLDNQNKLIAKQNILTSEFPHLLRYADMITPGDEESVRKQCQKLAEIREADLTQQKAILGGGVTNSPGAAPIVRPMADGDEESLKKALAAAAAKGPTEFEAEVQRQIEAYNSTR